MECVFSLDLLVVCMFVYTIVLFVCNANCTLCNGFIQLMCSVFEIDIIMETLFTCFAKY